MRPATALTALAIALLVGACSGATTPQPRARPRTDSKVKAHAAALRASAERLETTTTPRLTALAAAQRGRMVKLEHRFKSVESIERKLHLRIDQRGTDEIRKGDVIDALRYTMIVEDEPAGHYIQSIIAVLEALEADGHRVVRVKNYWPRGDNYSGVNVVLRVDDGFHWELQFHTTASAWLRDAWHKSYRLLRTPTTSLAERQRIFDAMAEPWARVPLPDGVLAGEGTLHETETIIRYQRP